MNIFFRKGTANNESNLNKDDSFVLQTSSKEIDNNNNNNNDDDDDILILTSTNNNNNNNKQIKNQTLLTQTVQQLFGKTSTYSNTNSSSLTINSNKIISSDEKNILEQNNTDEQLIDLN